MQLGCSICHRAFEPHVTCGTVRCAQALPKPDARHDTRRTAGAQAAKPSVFQWAFRENVSTQIAYSKYESTPGIRARRAPRGARRNGDQKTCKVCGRLPRPASLTDFAKTTPRKISFEKLTNRRASPVARIHALCRAWLGIWIAFSGWVLVVALGVYGLETSQGESICQLAPYCSSSSYCC